MMKLLPVHSYVPVHPWVRKVFFRSSFIGKPVFHHVSSLSRKRGTNPSQGKKKGGGGIRHGVKSCQRPEREREQWRQTPESWFFLAWGLSFTKELTIEVSRKM